MFLRSCSAMEPKSNESKSIQIIKSSPENTIELDEEALCNILLRDEIKDRYVSVISITGVFRQGKSFLLNFLVRYLQIRYVEMRDVTDWLRPEDGPLKGFDWSLGSRRHTAGIHMWPEIFLTVLPSGDKVAIILLDTQGSFDNQSAIDDCAKIFALSTLISSVQIYNMMQNIKQYDLSHLQLFGGYSSLLKSSSAPFQNICFLIRDWPYPYEHAYGAAGGLAYLEEVLSSDNAEVKNQVQYLRKLFKSMTGFLLPYPGRSVATSPSFNGNLNEIDILFKEFIQDFVINLLPPETLVLKSFNDHKVTAKSLVYFIQEYTKALKDESLPKVETIFKATVRAHHKSASCEAFKFYEQTMDCNVHYNSQCFSSVELYNKHSSTKVEAVEYYNQTKKIEDEEMHNEYLLDLKNNMDDKFEYYRKINDEKLKECHKSALHEAFALYKKNMDIDVKYSSEFFCNEGLSNKHTSNKVKAVAYYDKMKNLDAKKIYHRYLDDLNNNIYEEFQQYIEINKKKRNVALVKKVFTVVSVAATVVSVIGALGVGGATVGVIFLGSLGRFGKFIPFK